MQKKASLWMVGVSRLFFGCILWGMLFSQLVWAGEDDWMTKWFLPDKKTADKEPDKKANDKITTNLRDLIDAYGLLLLIAEGNEEKLVRPQVEIWRKHFQEILENDNDLKNIEKEMRRLFAQGIAEPGMPNSFFEQQVKNVDHKKLRPQLLRWMHGLFSRHKVVIAEDIKHLENKDQADICIQSKAMKSLNGLSAWRYRVLMWRYRDREVCRLFKDRDQRIAELTPIVIDNSKLTKETVYVIRRALDRLHNLRQQVQKDSHLPYDKFRTLDGLLNGLKYMETIRAASKETGLDHRVMTRLFIQESQFIHQRVSSSGAYSVAQFLDIALKDIWLFKSRIHGAKKLLQGIESYADLRAKVIADPLMAIKASCLYFRRIRDEVGSWLKTKSQRSDSELNTLLSLELFTIYRSVQEKSSLDVVRELVAKWPFRKTIVGTMLPLGPGLLFDPKPIVEHWLNRTLYELVHLRLSESVYQKRLERMKTAMGIAAYNAGMGNLKKMGKRRRPFEGLSFAVQLTETRNYVDDIIDGIGILQQVDKYASEVSQMDYQKVMDLAEEACKQAGL
jgi:hypothetical protein